MQVFDSDGVQLAFIDQPPSGEWRGTIVLVHGFASTHAVNWVNTLWVSVLADAGYRVVALDNRGHGASGKPHAPEAYDNRVLSGDVVRLLAHLDLPAAHLMGYSMGARISAYVALLHPEKVQRLVLGGLGIHLVKGAGLPSSIADAMDAPSLESLTDANQRMFRRFADANGADRTALSACIRGSRQALTAADVGRITCPTLVAVGTRDAIAGDPHELAALFPHGQSLDIPDRDHNLAVGDKVYKRGVIAFLDEHATG